MLAAMGLDARPGAAASIRLSLGYASTDADVERALAVIPAAVARLRTAAPRLGRRTVEPRGRGNGMSERIVVAMSGGVDSSVAAALLRRARATTSPG